jgi:hypothetical protein
MSSTDDNVEEVARRLEAAMSYPDKVGVRVQTGWVGGMCLPDPDGQEEEKAVFRTLTYGDNFLMEKACRFRIEGVEENEPPHYEVDVTEIRRLIVKRNLLSWTLDIPIERDGDWMTERCYGRVGSIPAPLMEAFLNEFEQSSMVTRDEEEEIRRQSVALFSPKSSGVAEACEAVSLFCTLGNYFDKFGLDREKLWGLPYREYILLKMMISEEGDAHRRDVPAPSVGSKTMIAGPGGHTRPSRGVVVRE